MNRKKRKELVAKGWKFGSAEEFLDLSPEEAAIVEIKFRFGESLKELRIENSLTQQELATRLHSSQSRIAKMEAGDPSVTLDRLVQSHLVLEAPMSKLGRLLASLDVAKT